MSNPKQLRQTAIALIVTGVSVTVIAAALALASFAPFAHDESATKPHSVILAAAAQRGYLRCEISNQLSGLAERGEPADEIPSLDAEQLLPEDLEGGFFTLARGIEADFCRAVALAVFGKPDAAAFRITRMSLPERMQALARGEVDVLFRSTAFHSAENAAYDIAFGPVYYFEPIVVLSGIAVDENDPQVVPPSGLYPAAAAVHSEAFRKLRVCSTKSTHTTNAARLFSVRHQRDWQLIHTTDAAGAKPFRNYLQVATAYEQGKCDAMVGRLSVLQHYQRNNPNGSNSIAASRMRPLGSNYVAPHVVAVSDADATWLDIVHTVIHATLDAQARGYSRDHADGYHRGTLWRSLGLEPANATELIRTLGNYHEIYQRNLAIDSPNSGANQHYLLDERGLHIVPY